MAIPHDAHESEPLELLHAQLDAATTAARDAYRDSAGLIRLLTVIGQPSSPEQLVDDTLMVLSSVFSADVTCVAQVLDDRLLVTNSCGLPEGDPAYTVGWPLGGAGALAAAGTVAVARSPVGRGDVPAQLVNSKIRSAAWVPLTSGQGAGDKLLIIFRRSGESFTPTDLQLLGAAANRLCLALEARERSFAIERLAQSGHRLARHLDLQSVLDEAVVLLRQLTATDSAWAFLIDGPLATLRATAGRVPTAVRRCPMPAESLPGWQAATRGQPYDEGSPPQDQDLGADVGTHPAGPPARRLLCVPVLRDGLVTALLYAARSTPRPFGGDALETSTIFATYLGAAMANAELYRALVRSESSLRLITDSISDMVAVVDADGRFVYASPSHARELSHQPDDLIGRYAVDLPLAADRERLQEALATAERSPTVEYRLRTGNGDWIWVETAMRPAPSTHGTVVLSSRVIDERKRLEDELRRRATHDPLTGLANRLLVGQRIDGALRKDGPDHVGLLFCDLDRFKAVNDRLGHEAGDELLLQVSTRLRRCMGPNDLLGRFGGDEFVIVLDGVGHLSEVTEVGQRVLSALTAPFPLRGERVQVSASIGGVLGVRGATNSSAMLRDADAAMYTAKEKGTGLVEVFDEAASCRSLDRLGIRSDLLRALDRGQLHVHYQPIFALDTGEVRSFEALLRWTHPQRGSIPPDVFIPFAEETGAVIPIGAWVLEQACQQLAIWQRMWPDQQLGMSVNLSAAQLQQADIAPAILAVVKDAGIDPDDLWLEVTESSYIRDDEAKWATALRAGGVHFTLDDFGVSYSNLSYLKRFPVEGMKIDRSFVNGLTAVDTDRSIVQAILAIGQTLGLTVVAEGIETAEQRSMLLDLGCQLGQGHLLSRPLPAPAATALLRNQQLSWSAAWVPLT